MQAPHPISPRWFHALAGGLMHSALMLLAGPPLAWWPLAVFSVVPLVWTAGRSTQRPWRAGLWAFLGAMPVWLVWQWWTHSISNLGFIPFAAIVALVAGVFVALLAWLLVRLPRLPLVLAGPILWTGLEYLRGEVAFDGYAWGFPVHPLIDAPFLAAPGAWGGVYAVSLLTGFLGVSVLLAVRRRWRWAVLCAAVPLVICAGAWFDLRVQNGNPRHLRVAAIQTNLLQDNKLSWALDDEVRDMGRFGALTREAAAHSPALIAWPETMMPGITLEPDALRQLATLDFTLGDGQKLPGDAFAIALTALQREVGVPLLIGEEARIGTTLEKQADGGFVQPYAHRFNSVYLVTEGRISPTRYDKIRLTPFGETMPYIRAWPALQNSLLDLGASGMRFDLDAGAEHTVFTIPAEGGPVRAVTPVCFESTVGSLCRDLVYAHGVRRADLIVNVTNDGWFGDSRLARLQHLQLARWRSLETGTPTLRAANTGICAIIDARGQVLTSGTLGAPGADRAEGVLVGEVEIPVRSTRYAAVGDAAGYASAAVSILTLLWARFRPARTCPPRATK